MTTLTEIIISRHLPKEEGGYRHERLMGGISGETYRVAPNTLDPLRASVVLTLIRDPALWWKVEQEYILRGLIANDQDVPLPQLYDAGFDVVDGEKIAYILREFIEGTVLDTVLDTQNKTPSSEQNVAQLAYDLGRRLGIMHQHGGSFFGQLGKAREGKIPSWINWVLDELDSEMKLISQITENTQLGSVRSIDIQKLLPNLQKLIGALQSSTSIVALPYLTHGDAHFKNIIANQKRNKFWNIKSFIDTEEILGGDPELDIAFIENWLYFSTYQKDFYKKRKNFQSGYTSQRSVEKRYGDRRLIYHALRSLSFLRTVFGFNPQIFLSQHPKNAEYVFKHFNVLKSLADGNVLEDIGIPALI